MINLEVTVGFEVDETEARNRARYLLDDEYDDPMTDEECAEIYADDVFNNGLGCYVRVL